MESLPTLKLELQQVRYTMLCALTRYHEQIEQYAEKEIARTIDEFDWQGTVTEAISAEIPRVIRSAIHEAITRAVYTNEVQQELDVIVISALIDVLRQLEAKRA